MVGFYMAKKDKYATKDRWVLTRFRNTSLAVPVVVPTEAQVDVILSALEPQIRAECEKVNNVTMRVAFVEEVEP